MLRAREWWPALGALLQRVVVRFVFTTLGPAVMERQGGGRHVEIQAPGEGVDACQVRGLAAPSVAV